MELFIGIVVALFCIWFVLGIDITYCGDRQISNIVGININLTPVIIIVIFSFLIK